MAVAKPSAPSLLGAYGTNPNNVKNPEQRVVVRCRAEAKWEREERCV